MRVAHLLPNMVTGGRERMVAELWFEIANARDDGKQFVDGVIAEVIRRGMRRLAL